MINFDAIDLNGLCGIRALLLAAAVSGVREKERPEDIIHFTEYWEQYSCTKQGKLEGLTPDDVEMFRRHRAELQKEYLAHRAEVEAQLANTLEPLPLFPSFHNWIPRPIRPLPCPRHHYKFNATQLEFQLL